MSDFTSMQAALVDFFNPDAQSLFDYVVSAISMLGSWQLLGALGIIALLKKRLLGKKLLLALAITLLIVYPVKMLVDEPRPCAAYENVRAVGACKGTGSFPSAHAALAFAYFAVLSREFKERKTLLLATAAAVSLSRLYLGQHYPLDVMAGALIGYLTGYAVDDWVKYKYPVKRHVEKYNSKETKND